MTTMFGITILRRSDAAVGVAGIEDEFILSMGHFESY